MPGLSAKYAGYEYFNTDPDKDHAAEDRRFPRKACPEALTYLQSEEADHIRYGSY